MRLIRFSTSIWFDPHWRANFRRSWRARRFWLAAPATNPRSGRALALQFGPLTFKIHFEGPAERSSPNG